MGIKGPSVTRGITTKKGSSPFHFLRVLRYSKPYMRYLYPALVCVVFVALTYSINIMALLPTIKIIAGEQGIPTWVHETIVEERLDLDLGEDGGVIFIVRIGDDFASREEVRRRDHLVEVEGRRDTPKALMHALAHDDGDGPVRLGLVRADDQRPYEVVVTAKPVSAPMRLAREVVSWLPQGDDKSAKMTTLSIILGVVLFIGLVGAVCRFFGEYLISLVAGRTVVAMRRRMYERVLKLPVAHYSVHGVSDLVSRFVQDSQDVYRGLNFVFAKSLREPLKAIFVFIVALVIDWRITLIAVISAPLAGLLIRKFGRLIRKANKRLLENYGRMLASLEGAMTGIRVVKGYAMEQYERRHLFTVDQQILKQQLKIARTEAMSSPIFETIGRIAATIAILYFAHLMFEDQMTFAKFGTLGACMAGMFDPVRKMSSFYNRIQRANAALDRVFEVLEMPEHEPNDHKKPALAPLQNEIEFRNVMFTYPGSDRPALNGVSLVVKRGERVAFVGPNGSGKTTLLSLLIRFFDPDEGQLLFDGRDASEHSLSSLRRQMSLITQDTVIFADTIANNVAYGDDRLLRRIVLKKRHPDRNYHFDSEEQRIVDAAKAAHADDFIRQKPDGYNTYVGEHGITLSGGQKQRIAIARAILRNAPIFIFDEATSQIDAESEQKIHDAVEKFLQGRTALIIAHRFSTILQADRIVVMDQGRIVDSGPHSELIKRCELYQSLYGSQIIKDEN
ncbi:MAG: ABC transporter ATP-binding protein/permease [Phycisphaerales bacterium]|nr:ABC transporter ATP-binding protein/permease [Phycisphaerales bacterium]